MLFFSLAKTKTFNEGARNLIPRVSRSLWFRACRGALIAVRRHRCAAGDAGEEGRVAGAGRGGREEEGEGEEEQERKGSRFRFPPITPSYRHFFTIIQL